MEFWIRISPSGCVTGSVLGYTADTPGEAHREFTPDHEKRADEKRKGWRHELVDSSTWDRVAKPCLRGVCAHRTGRNPKPERGRRRDDRVCQACGHVLAVHDDGQPCGERWDVCGDPDCEEPYLERQVRRGKLHLLLSRMDRGVLLPEERKLLRAAVMVEIDDVEMAYARLARMKLEARR